MLPERMPFSTPSRPIATASTSLGPGRDVKVMSLASATSAGELPSRAPSSSRGRVMPSLMSNTTIGYPARWIFRDIPPPIFPKPIKPTVSITTPHNSDFALL